MRTAKGAHDSETGPKRFDKSGQTDVQTFRARGHSKTAGNSKQAHDLNRSSRDVRG
ncbi:MULTISPECIES: hypothetical protein [Paenibacillus]|uniref:hypothetical protein n=1 Tax=Paenibacillus TaxID=44249 RepID=UPI001427A3FD|nr:MULTISPECIES: hypothetical protein [Paenibacillus]MCM3494467.1 hypothetical protein [Paenibacillus lactis]